MTLDVLLATLAAEIAEARRLRYLPSLEAVDRWDALAREAAALAASSWLSEPEFRLRTGASAKWCRGNYARCERAGLAKRDERERRLWHQSVRPPKRVKARDAEAAVEAIVGSYGRAS